MAFLHAEQKKGDPDRLDGRLTVFAVVEIDPDDIADMKHPVASMVHNGLLVAQGNFKEQNSLRDFLKSEMGLSLEEGLEQLLDKMEGLESALDPEKLRNKIEDMEEMQDFIPTPAKIVSFHTESEIMEQDGDIFYVGKFRNAGNAVLSVNALPIFYQARFREQQIENVRSEIENLISQIENAGPPNERYSTEGLDVEQKTLREFIPNMLYCRRDENVFLAAERQFRTFMSGYPVAEDVDAIIRIINSSEELTSRHYRILELYARKIAEMRRENFSEVRRLHGEIEKLQNNNA